MRGWLHSFVVGALVCSLSVDTAKACWHLRRGSSACCRRVVCGPARVVCPTACDPCGVVVYGGSGWAVVGESVCGCGGSLAVASDVVAGEPAVAAKAPSEPTPADTPAPADALAAVTPKAEAVPAPVDVAPKLEPAGEPKPAVEPTAALEPAKEPMKDAKPSPSTDPGQEPDKPPLKEPAKEPAASEPAPVEPAPKPAPTPVEPNIFEEVEKADRGGADAEEPAVTTEPKSDDDDAPAPKPAATPAPAADDPFPALDEPAVKNPRPADAGPADEEKSVQENPASDEAAAEPTEKKPAAEPAEADPFSDAGGERVRRWIDDTGRYATVGVLVDVRAEGIEIRKANGRSVIVPLDRLSEHDRAYAAAAGERLAAKRQAAPESSDTAGL